MKRTIESVVGKGEHLLIATAIAICLNDIRGALGGKLGILGKHTPHLLGAVAVVGEEASGESAVAVGLHLGAYDTEIRNAVRRQLKNGRTQLSMLALTIATVEPCPNT